MEALTPVTPSGKDLTLKVSDSIKYSTALKDDLSEEEEEEEEGEEEEEEEREEVIEEVEQSVESASLGMESATVKHLGKSNSWNIFKKTKK